MTLEQDSLPSARLSYRDFEIAIKAFLKQAEYHAPWSYVEYSGRGQQKQGYLSMTQLKHSHQSSRLTSGTQDGSYDTSAGDQLLLDDLVEQLEEIPDDGEDGVEPLDLAQDVSHDFLSVSYHIVFSPSYQVPVLYFNAYKPNGQAIPLEDIYESLVPEDWRSSIRDSGLSGGISQQDHPILNVPFFYMHPCETVSLMETILGRQTMDSPESFLSSYIASWLSLTGQAIGITLPSAMVSNTLAYAS